MIKVNIIEKSKTLNFTIQWLNLNYKYRTKKKERTFDYYIGTSGGGCKTNSNLIQTSYPSSKNLPR